MKDKALYLSNMVFAKYSNFSHGVGDNQELGPRYFDWCRAFFNHLPERIKKDIVYRDYPKNEWGRMWQMYYDSIYELGDSIAGVGYEDGSLPWKPRARDFKLIICSYIGTGFLEALCMGVPVICFLRRDCTPLHPDFEDIFDSLLKTKIMHDDPIECCKFLDLVWDNGIEGWNELPHVKWAKEKWITHNLGDPAWSINYLTGLTSGTS